MDAKDDKQLLRKSLTIVPTPPVTVSERNDSISEPETNSPLEEEESSTFDQSITAHQYVESFRLKFYMSESTNSAKDVINAQAQPELNRAASGFEEEISQKLICSSSEVELQEISLKFIGEGKPSYWI